MTNQYELLDESGVVKRSEVKTSHIRWYGKYEIELLEKSGFSNVSTHGDFQDMEYEDGSVALAVSYRLIEKCLNRLVASQRVLFAESLEEKLILGPLMLKIQD